ncbi:carbohydrate ABC transporter permease [Candidatus Leptofilum sp.]|uniref:carbohydrate ABC transporter permease n=1 Tax=Candidatus Leptofilum sp. TaxID=3241576 RepID=UPI003B5C9800
MTANSQRLGFWRNRAARNETIAAYMFLAPYLIVTLVFTIGVVAFAFYISLTNYNLFTTPEWNNFDHFKTLLGDAKFGRSLVNVLYYVIIVVTVQTVLALLLAVVLNAPIRAKQFYRTLFYAPSVTSAVVISFIFWWLYLKTGYLNYGISKIWELFGAEWEAINWLNDPRGLFQLIVEGITAGRVSIPSSQWYLRGPSITWMAIMAQNIFTTVPTFMIMFLAALQDIPASLYEAASIDGANKRQQFFRVTVPMLRPVLLLVVVLGTIGTWQIFDQVAILTAGGPLDTTLTPVYFIYTEALGISGPPRMGYASSRAIVLAIIILTFTFVQRRYIEGGTEQY